MRPQHAVLSCLLLAIAAVPRLTQAQSGPLKPFKIEGHKIPEIKTPEQPSYKITKPEPYKVTPPATPKGYGVVAAPKPTTPTRGKSEASRTAAARKPAPASRRVVAPRSAAPPPAQRAASSGKGRGRLLRGFR
ncbi:MAG: hypothetical protein ABI910_04110 [Gemmatimonadota bacterium]